MKCQYCGGNVVFTDSESWIEDDGINRIQMITKYFQCQSCGQDYEKNERAETQFDDSPEYDD